MYRSNTLTDFWSNKAICLLGIESDSVICFIFLLKSKSLSGHYAEVGSAACFSGPQYTIPQLCYCSAQKAITQCFQICQCNMRSAAIADTSAMHNHSKEKIKSIIKNAFLSK